jgi:hypothetical protein
MGGGRLLGEILGKEAYPPMSVQTDSLSCMALRTVVRQLCVTKQMTCGKAPLQDSQLKLPAY